MCELLYARVKCYICHAIGDPQLGINRFGLSLLLGHEDLVTDLHCGDK
jgi:predicted deacylase